MLIYLKIYGGSCNSPYITHNKYYDIDWLCVWHAYMIIIKDKNWIFESLMWGGQWVKDLQRRRLDNRFEKTQSIYSFGDQYVI